MDRRLAANRSENWTGVREGACALLAAMMLVWHAWAGDAKIRACEIAQAGGSCHSAEKAEKELREAAAFRKKMTKRDLREAVRLYRTSASGFQRAGTPERAAVAEVEAGNTLNMMSEFEQAIVAYRQALALGRGKVSSRCEALTGLAWTQANMGRSARALRAADEAVIACAPLKDEDPQAYERAVEAKGEAEFWSEHLEEATATLTSARQLAAQAGDEDGEALSAMFMAEIVHPDDPEAAHRLIATAMDLWTHSGNSYGAARGNLALAYFVGREGDYSAAECESKRALEVFERVADNDNAGVAFNVLGMVARRSGDLEAAARDYGQARKLFILAKDQLGEGEALSGLMEVSVDRNDASNPELYVRGLTVAEATGNQGLQATALAGTGDVMFRQRRFILARAEYQKSLNAARNGGGNPYEEALAQGRLARVEMAMGNLKKALGSYLQAQALEEKAGAIEDVARTQYMRARIYVARNEPLKALAEIEKTIAIIEQQRLRISKFESRAQYFAWVHEYYALYIRVLMEMERIEPDGQYMRRAFEASERSKVRALLDELANSPQTVNCDEPLVEAARPEEISAPPNSEDMRLDKSVNAETAMESVEQIQAEMREGGTTLIEFALGEESSFAWLVDGRSISAIELAGGAEIRSRVERLRQTLEPLESYGSEMPEEFLGRREAQTRAVQEQVSELGRLLFGTMRLPAGKRLIIVPDGPLQYLPFAALATPAGEPLVERYELAMLPSAAALTALRKSRAGRPAPQDEVVVIADPVYERRGAVPEPSHGTLTSKAIMRSAELTRALEDLHKTETIPNLPGSRIEALNIQRILGASHTRLALGYEANRDAVLRGVLAQARVIHFATHGLLDARHPENSGLLLALFNPQGQAQDGYLRVSDIRGLKLSADLVVLSSCESALGKDMGSEGIIGLPRAFLYAGAQRVIASLWKVDDEAAAALMASFYEALKAGESPTEALNQAQRKLRRDPRFSDPYFWAAFFIEGELR